MSGQYGVTLEDRMRWAQLADTLSNHNIYTVSLCFNLSYRLESQSVTQSVNYISEKQQMKKVSGDMKCLHRFCSFDIHMKANVYQRTSVYLHLFTYSLFDYIKSMYNKASVYLHLSTYSLFDYSLITLFMCSGISI